MINTLLRIYNPDNVKAGTYKYKIVNYINGVKVAEIKLNALIHPKPPQVIKLPNKIENCGMEDVKVIAGKLERVSLSSCFRTIQSQSYILDINVNLIKRFASYAYNTFTLYP